jgi:hypothetical protein
MRGRVGVGGRNRVACEYCIKRVGVSDDGNFGLLEKLRLGIEID